MKASQKMKEYFEDLQKNISAAHNVASIARLKNFDPENSVETVLAKNMAERVVGLLSTISPQIINSGIVERIIELENQYGILDWRVAFKVAEEICFEKFCKFKDKKEAIEIGIRTGFAYLTLGTVSSPLDGFLGIEFMKRTDNRGEFFCLNFAGPIRNAGGTAAAVCVLIADYVRKKTGYDVYDATNEEIKRTHAELINYHERVTNLQYVPSQEETDFLMKNIPVLIGGDASEKIEVSNYKDLPRMKTNFIRSGFCLVLSSCIPLKAPKLWKQLNSWGKEFDMSQWSFLEEYLKIQKASKSKGASSKSKEKISPDYTYISDLVAGRPVLSYPLRNGGFRLRYGRSRISGYSGQSIHPATMFILNKFIATGTQLKVERPGKATSLTSCDTIEGPTVKLEDSSVVQLNSLSKAKTLSNQIKEIIYLGDILICYGDFFDRAHTLVPAGYCEEWWIQEFEKSIIKKLGSFDLSKVSDALGIKKERLELIFKHSALIKLTAKEAFLISEKFSIPFHPRYTFFWSSIKTEELIDLMNWFSKCNVFKKQDIVQKIVLPLKPEKRVLELLGVFHSVVHNEFVVIEKDIAAAFYYTLFLNKKPSELVEIISYKKDLTPLEIVNSLAPFKIRDKAGTFIGARMGRPEKAKQRKLIGSPHTLFPVGDEGGKFRSFQSCLENGKIFSSFALFKCSNCNTESVFSNCMSCNSKTQRIWRCKICGPVPTNICSNHGEAISHTNRSFSIREPFYSCLTYLGMTSYPDLIKGVRGTSNKHHIPEHFAKGILRAKYDIYVNKDGTTRYDMTQLPMTHFKPKEIETSVEKLRSLGYKKDIHNNDLINENQILELKPQDVVLPACEESNEEGANHVLFKVANFIDELLVKFYKQNSFYNLSSEKDLIGQMVVCLAPHTSAGIVGRIIGFSKTQGFFAHPLLHAATRRDCDGDELCVLLLMDNFLNYSKHFLPDSRGATMDAPLVLTSILDPSAVDDMAFNVDVAWKYPLELYEAALEYKMPWDVKIEQIKSRLGTSNQYENMGFTHDVSDLNSTVLCSSYKTLPSMEEKLKGQMDISEKIRAVNSSDVAQLVIEKHFLKDAKGNLRKFSTQEFRCVTCNEKYRRPPLIGKCVKCHGKIIFTVSEGNIMKYVQPTISLAKKYNVSPYLKQVIDLLQKRIEGVFGREKEKQVGLGNWFG